MVRGHSQVTVIVAGHTHRDAVREHALDASVSVGAVRRERDGIESRQLPPV
jgi:UDP-2,3-diacylglucosamine pyrophosphatase LpxH